MKIQLVCVICLIISIGLSSNYVPPASGEVAESPTLLRSTDSLSEYNHSDPINITRNADFAEQGWPGNGTLDNPYRISNLNITSPGPCLTISDTNVVFTIENCYLSSTDYSNLLMFDGTWNATIKDCVLLGKSHDPFSIYIRKSFFLSMNNCTISGKTAIFHSAYVVIENCTTNEVYFYSSGTSTLANTYIVSDYHEAIEIRGGSRIDVDNCRIENVGSSWGIYLQSYYGHCALSNLEIVGCYRYGIKTMTSNDILFENCTISGISGPGIMATIDPVQNLTIMNCNVTNSQVGLYLRALMDSTIFNNSVTNNEIGVELDTVFRCQFKNNSVTRNDQYGIVLNESHYNTFGGNTVCNNTGYGFAIDSRSSSNSIYGNTIGWNLLSNAIDNGRNNLWWDNVSIGNFWSDYDCSGLYQILGTANSRDMAPFLLGGICNITSTPLTLTTPSETDTYISLLSNSVTVVSVMVIVVVLLLIIRNKFSNQ